MGAYNLFEAPIRHFIVAMRAIRNANQMNLSWSRALANTIQVFWCRWRAINHNSHTRSESILSQFKNKMTFITFKMAQPMEVKPNRKFGVNIRIRNNKRLVGSWPQSNSNSSLSFSNADNEISDFILSSPANVTIHPYWHVCNPHSQSTYAA